ncbi:MAG: hypothetical protein IIY75_04630 [Erysipelotrichales bacterium]|nr:hypothetical protein [Erysipelotrichales bacterium]
MDQRKVQEYKTVQAINGKRVGELAPGVYSLVKFLFPEAEEEAVLSAELCNRFSKPDIYVEWNKNRRYISLKSGRSDSVHFENVRSFLLFLRGLNVSEETQKTVLRFHYGDGTLNGTGRIREGFDTLYRKMQKELTEANRELSEKKVVRAGLTRFVFKGTEARSISADYLAYGDPSCYVVCSREEVEMFVLGRNYDHIRTLHIGPMMIQPYLRDPEHIGRHTEKRNIVQVKWHYLLKDLEKIRSQNRS